MTEKKYRVHDWVKFDYSEIGEYIGESYTDKPLRNDEIVDLLNEQYETIQSLISDSEKYRKLSIQFDNRNKELVSENALLEKENEQLKQSYSDLETSMDICRNARDVYSKKILEVEKENEQLKQEVDYSKQVASQYSNELNVNDFIKSRNDKEKSCGYCKNYNLDGMFGIWCSIHETPTSDKYCQDFEWNR